MQLEGQFWITHNGKNLAGQSRIELLTQIASSGSITQAAKAVGISYKSAWDAVEAMNSAAGSPLVARSTGGKGVSRGASPGGARGGARQASGRREGSRRRSRRSQDGA